MQDGCHFQLVNVWAELVQSGKAGHSATSCPTLDESFPFMLPGWTAKKVVGGYAMISPQAAAERHRAENGDRSGMGGSPPRSAAMFDPRTPMGEGGSRTDRSPRE